MGSKQLHLRKTYLSYRDSTLNMMCMSKEVRERGKRRGEREREREREREF